MSWFIFQVPKQRILIDPVWDRDPPLVQLPVQEEGVTQDARLAMSTIAMLVTLVSCEGSADKNDIICYSSHCRVGSNSPPLHLCWPK